MAKRRPRNRKSNRVTVAEVDHKLTMMRLRKLCSEARAVYELIRELRAEFQRLSGQGWPQETTKRLVLLMRLGIPLSGTGDYDEIEMLFWAIEHLRTVTPTQMTAAPPEPDALHPDDLRLLRALNDSGATMKQEDLAATTRLSRGTLGRRLKRLREMGHVARPMGDRGGDAITDKGRQAVGAQ
jgi:uncharacterized membrane protein